MPTLLTNPQKEQLKAQAQRLEPYVKLGHAGISAGFLQSLNEALSKHGLVKIKFAAFKEQKKALAPQIAEATGSELVMRVGNVAVYYRKNADPA